MIRFAALLLLVSQAILLWLLYQPTGPSAILFSFVGTPLLGIGLLLLLVVALRERHRKPPGAG
jgi:hypothetical protein